MAEYKILEYDYGFFVKNYVGNYKILEFDNEKYIVSDEYYNAKDNKKELKTKEIFVDEYKEEQYVVMKLSKINIDDDNEIIKFCNNYGLPYSSVTILENLDKNIRERRLYDYICETEHCFFHHDCITRAEFCKYVVNAKNYLILLSELKNQTPDMKKLICSLLYILIFERIWDKNFLEPDEFVNYTLIGQFRYNLQEKNFYELYNASSINEILNVLSEFCEQTAKDSEVLRDYCNDVLNLIDKLIPYIDKNGYSINIDENYDIKSENDFAYSQELKQTVCKMCYRVLADSITEGISDVRQVLFSNDNKNGFKATHKFQYMYEGIYQELFLLCTNGERIHKCQNTTCRKFFISNNSRKKFCSNECTITVAKRKQRELDKINPDRKRELPQFKGKIKNKENSTN